MGKVQQLIIVCDKKTEKYANYLRQLITTNDDTEDEVVGTVDGSVDVSVWLDKYYSDNKATLSSNVYVLFMGESKVCKEETSSMFTKYDEYGMTYGWLGKRGMLRVDKSLSKEEYDNFIDYCLSFQEEYDKLIVNGKAEKKQKMKQELAEMPEDEKALVEKKAKTKKTVKTIATSGGIAAATIGFGLIGATSCLVGIGIGKGINKIKDNKEIKAQQYRALTSLLYIYGLQKFLEG